MFAGTNTTPKLAILITASLLEQRSKICPKTGCAPSAALARTSSVRLKPLIVPMC